MGMAKLFLHKRRVPSVFHLLGEYENDITYSVAWALANSRAFLDEFLKETLGLGVDLETVVIRLQDHEKQAGITDIEIESPGIFFLIIEAKRGWTTPSLKQLTTYALRESFRRDMKTVRRIIPMSACGKEHALHTLGCSEIEGVAVCPMSWKDLAKLAARSQRNASHAEKRLLGELLTYLRGIMTLQNLESNWVYVVSLGSGIPKGWGISWINIVEKRLKYFHALGGRWPKEPPNYIAFRYRGKLQSIHHIQSAEVFTNPHSKFKEIPDTDWGPHFLYSLGPGFAPAHEVPMGKLYPNGRNWCMLDTLFTSATISEARDISAERANAGE